MRLTGSDALAARAGKKLKGADGLVPSLGPTILQGEMERVPLWRGNHVSVRQLVEDFARYLYLTRITGPEVLLAAIRDGLGLLTWKQETFAYADGYDEAQERYAGLRGGKPPAALDADSRGLLVRPAIAAAQLEAEAPQVTPGVTGGETGGGTPGGDVGDGGTIGPNIEPGKVTPPQPRRYHGPVVLDSMRVGADAGKIASELIVQLTGLPGSSVKVTLEIEAEIPQGAPEQVVRTVSENSRSLKFTSFGFEQE